MTFHVLLHVAAVFVIYLNLCACLTMIGAELRIALNHPVLRGNPKDES